MSRTVLVRITGRVQGVGYRDWCHRRARALGLSGWVRNRHSGEVEALFAGPDEAVGIMLADCRNGPSLAVVSDVNAVDADEPVALGFEVLPTA
ncbi:Acylphosphatase [Hartmannibacter diazotrophicus]|uniref:acylphosphatase n=1 Tax=Hartmannibacter diazotrophicus TaxID=1482074 RepID=A0A2C9D783_9HYPH|nr:acylphosphatase [Hartmannibacter diazotrophicus]SON56039.1 Acylphosphatase [Hartmannibacter diazotrophicus]